MGFGSFFYYIFIQQSAQHRQEQLRAYPTYSLSFFVGLRSNTDGNVIIPVKFFQTLYLRPYRMQKLQPNGMRQVQETVHAGVIDIDGQIKIRIVKGQMPTIRFETTKPVR